MHRRRAILEAAQIRLKTLSDFSGVWIQRISPTRNAFPGITLYADAENCETTTIHVQPRKQDRVLTVVINAWFRGTANDEKVESDMDAAALLIESVMSLPTGADDILLVATDFKVAEDEPEIHVCSLTYHVSYNSTEYNPV